mgnify:CR=1 FL=1
MYEFLINKKLPKDLKAKIPDTIQLGDLSEKKAKKIMTRKRDDWTDDEQIVYPGSKMIDIFMEASDFANLFENETDPDQEMKDDLEAPSSTKYWEKVFANATTDAHKLFKSQKDKMYIESFEDILRKILRYRNT